MITKQKLQVCFKYVQGRFGMCNHLGTLGTTGLKELDLHLFLSLETYIQSNLSIADTYGYPEKSVRYKEISAI